MAKITMTFEDQLDGSVRVECTPNMKDVIMMDMSGHQLTPAHGFALAAVNVILKRSREQEREQRSGLVLPHHS